MTTPDPTPATQTRHEVACVRAKFQRLHECPDAQAEAIANHYTKLASMAADLRSLVESRRYAEPSEQVDAMIEHLVQTIKREHMHDFGLFLEWL